MLFVLFAALVGIAVAVERQGVDAGPARFEVASIRRSTSQDGFVRMQVQPGGGISMTNVTLRALIRTAFRVQEYQIIDAPAWATTERYDIAAKADGPATPERLMPMLRALLEERFKLRTRTETRNTEMYALVLAGGGGSLEPQLRKAGGDCPAPGAAPVPNAAAGTGQCGMRSIPGSIVARGIPLATLTTTLSGILGRMVNDRMGLSGTFDLDVKWTPVESTLQPVANALGIAVDPNGGDGASIFTALREQLGLRLDTERGPMEMVVIESAERPSEN